MQKLDTLTSTNIVSQNIEKLKALFPTAFSEDRLIIEELQLLVGEYIEKDKEYYQMTWAGKARAQQEANKVSTGTLRPSKVESKYWEMTGNILIEGDNLEVLKLLQKAYSNKIKMIYIDPPYNTGKDFVYKDNYADNLGNYLALTGQTDKDGKKLSSNTDNDGRYHSNWLNMIYPRLKLAHNLLTEDGVIFVSIDDNEQANLKKVCDEIFGEENFVSVFCWEKKKKPSFLSRNLGNKFEYILVFAKNRNNTHEFSVELTTEGKKYPFNNAGNGMQKLIFPAGSVKFQMPDQKIHPQDMSEGKIKTYLQSDLVIENGVNKSEFVLEGEWRYSQNKLNEIVENQEAIVISKIPFRPNHIKSGGEIKKMHNLLTLAHYKIATNEDGDKEQAELLGGNYFDYTKPAGLIKFLLRSFMYNDPHGLILDFFAGSGTTAHAVMALNAEDGGNRKCISVQLPEPIEEKSDAYKTIAEITKERIRRAGELVIKEHADKEGIEKLDVGFRVFKLDSSNIHAWDTSLEKLQDQLDMFDAHDGDHIKADRTEEDVLFEILLKYGLELTLPIQEREIAGCRVHNIGFGTLYICLSNVITAEVAQGIGEWQQEFGDAKTSVIFKDAGFKDDQDKTNTVQTLRQFGIENVKSI